jgi:hypothetical protein
LENQEREIIEGRFTNEQKVMEQYEQITNRKQWVRDAQQKICAKNEEVWD